MNKFLMPVVLAFSIIAAPAMADNQMGDANLVFNIDQQHTADNLELMPLSNTEMQATEGEVFPMFLLGFATRFTTSQLFKHYASNASLAYGTYSFGNYLSNR